jgi:dTMP kinase
MAHGLFVTFEGIDACGKSTQLRLVAEALKAQGRAVEVTREPGGTAIAESIRAVVMDVAHGEMSPECEVLLYLAARAQHVAQRIAPALQTGAVVLCDRFADATFAYQGYGRGLDLEQLRRLNTFATGGRMPDLTLLFDITVELSRARLAQQQRGLDRMESGSLEFFGKVRQGYLSLAAQEPGRFVVIDGSLPLDTVAVRVQSVIAARL